MKSPGTRNRLMATLMISSQLLLTGFMVYWLGGQYREERTKLREQLVLQYIQVHDQLLDSMLMKHLVIPSLDDSLMVRIHREGALQHEEGVDSEPGLVVIKEYSSEPTENPGFNTIHFDQPGPGDSIIRTIGITSEISDEERMVRSVKLFINKNPLTFQRDSGSLQFFAMGIDSCSLLSNLEHSFIERDRNLLVQWPVGEPGIPEPAKRRGMVISAGPDSQTPEIQVLHMGAFLIRSIIPQILFGLILLLLSASALWFAYRSLQRQLALNRLRDDFISNISHELKTPVSTVKIALEALLSFDMKKDPRVSGQYLEMATRELERLERLVGKVLHHEMLNNSSLVLDKEPCDLGGLARNVLRTMEIPIEKARARITLKETGEPCVVHVDRIYVEGMLMNLLDNSLKYAGESPEILILMECSSAGTALSVTDDGPGIPEEYRDQVFEKFFRIPSGDKHNVKGYGLGLNFASQVMEQHGGTIAFQNLPEGGCRFTLRFPGAAR